MQPFSTIYTPLERAGDLLSDRRLLALVEFTNAPVTNGSDPRHVSVGMPQLGSERLLEAWMSPSPVDRGRAGEVAFARNEHVLLGSILVDESRHENLEAASRHAYGRVLEFARSAQFPYFLRIWNYIPNINEQEHGLERYRAFCVGRHRAFEAGAVSEHLLPAASGVGSHSGDLLLFFLAAREPGTQVENPRQVSAFRYPRRYGPRSPAFSRAVVKTWGQAKHLYISGTASIVGHESRHEQAVIAQLDETLRNLDTLLERVASSEGVDIGTLSELSLMRMYVRQPEDVESIRRHVSAALGANPPMLFVSGELCRRNLLLELEGLYAGPSI